MGAIEKYEKWHPASKLFRRVMVERLEDSDAGLSIYIRNIEDKKKFRILFDSYIAYRNMDESYRAKTASEHNGFDSSLYLVEHSSWIRWLHEESLGYYSDVNINHYADNHFCRLC